MRVGLTAILFDELEAAVLEYESARRDYAAVIQETKTTSRRMELLKELINLTIESHSASNSASNSD